MQRGCTVITNLSNHIPILVVIDTTNRIGIEFRAALDQKIWGIMTLQIIIVQYAQAYGPNARFIKTYCSASTPEYQAMKNSIPYA